MSIKIRYKDDGRVHLIKINEHKGHDFLLEESSGVKDSVFMMYRFKRRSDDFATGYHCGSETMSIANDDIPDVICALIKYMEGLKKCAQET
jgi:hypothetical protein